jgi:hypothetical protein
MSRVIVVPSAAASLAALLLLQACGANTTPSKVGTTTATASAEPLPSAAPVASTHTVKTLDDDYPDPSRLLVDNYASDDDTVSRLPAKPGNSGLTVSVHESGPDEPWNVVIVNQGESPAELIADSRLLWFEVKVPGQKKPTSCKLPDRLGPTEPERRLRVTLLPGEGVKDTFDPRLYCFAEGEQKLLVPGAQIVAHFGWANSPPKKRWKGGKLVEEPVVQRAPFVAQRTIAKPTTAPKEDDTTVQPVESEPAVSTRAKPTPKKRGKSTEKSVATLAAEAVAARSDKELVGNTFALRSEYATWSRRANPTQSPAETDAESPVLGLRLIQGSDARAEHNATVQLTLENQGRSSTHVYFRREMVSFEVTGPKGITLCAATPTDRTPEARSFLKLEAHGKRTFTSRLAELCPSGTFATPGLYLVFARFDATESGEEQGLHAFTGPVICETPAAVRIRVGEASLLQKRMMPLHSPEGEHPDELSTESKHKDKQPTPAHQAPQSPHPAAPTAPSRPAIEPGSSHAPEQP